MQDRSSTSNIPETPGVSLDDFSSEDNDEFIVEDPMRMTRRSTQRPVLQSTKHSTTATSSNHKVSATPVRSPKIDVSDAVEVLSQASSGTNDVQKKPRMTTRDDPGSNPERQPLLKDYENRMWSLDFKGYAHPYPGKENHTTVYRTKL